MDTYLPPLKLADNTFMLRVQPRVPVHLRKVEAKRAFALFDLGSMLATCVHEVQWHTYLAQKVSIAGNDLHLEEAELRVDVSKLVDNRPERLVFVEDNLERTRALTV